MGIDNVVSQKSEILDDFLAMLKTLLRRYQKVITELWVDNARWHEGKRITEFLHIHRRLRMEYIPKYHPEFQERLGKTMRYEETTNTYYDTFESLNRAVFADPKDGNLKNS